MFWVDSHFFFSFFLWRLLVPQSSPKRRKTGFAWTAAVCLLSFVCFSFSFLFLEGWWHECQAGLEHMTWCLVPVLGLNEAKLDEPVIFINCNYGTIMSHTWEMCVFVLSFSQITNYKYSALSSVDMTLAQLNDWFTDEPQNQRITSIDNNYAERIFPVTLLFSLIW